MEAFEGSFEKEKQVAELAKALQGVQLAIIPAGVPRKPGMTRDDLFNINAGGWADSPHLQQACGVASMPECSVRRFTQVVLLSCRSAVAGSKVESSAPWVKC